MSYLVLLRHGESDWNAKNLFTGWADVDLTEKGEDEARAAGHLLLAERYLDLRVLHTSLLTRAVRTANLTLETAGLPWLPVNRHWRLNERHYGALQGLNKIETTEKYGAEQVKIWRRSYATQPPALELEDERHPIHDRRYRDLIPSVLPSTECLADVVARAVPYWEDVIVPDLRNKGDVLVVAHGNSIRALVKYLLKKSDDEIVDLEIPTGVPWVFELSDQLTVVENQQLGDPEAIRRAAEAVARQAG
jgi:2,3-bisphosphoglycerate-dependent phosphoglycerate mutase